MIIKKRFIAIVIGLATLVGIIAISSVLLKSSITVDLSGSDAPVGTIVTIKGNAVDPSGEGGVLYKTDLSSGDVEIVVTSPIHKNYSESIKLGIGKKLVIKPKLEPKQAVDIAANFYGADYSVVANEKQFPGGWVAFNAVPKEGDETVVVVARLDADTSEWQIVSEGSSYFPEDLVDAPNELIMYLDTL
jgi:hypothetical protein